MTEIALEPFHEFRFEVNAEQELKVFVIEGNCEILGQELLNERWHTFRNTKSFLYTLKGCKLRVEGTCELQYVSDDSVIPEIVALFLSLNKNPKRTLILGKSRSTVAVTLLNLFIRAHKKVVFAELDPGTGNLIFPGVIGSVLVDNVVDFSKGFEMFNMLVYFYGSSKINDKDHYYRILEELSAKEHEHLTIILGPNNLDHIKKVHEMFKVDRVVVVGDERLLNMIPTEMEKSKIKLSSGVTEDNSSKKVHDYFYGKNDKLTPFSLNLRDQRIFSKENEMLAPESALPLGTTRKMKVDAVKEVEFLNNYVMAIVDCQSEDDILTSPAIGFFLALEKETLRVLAPQSKLPKEKFLLRGDIKYFEN
jgi:polyribonucleotide 5'-hydroxyl-kinase